MLAWERWQSTNWKAEQASHVVQRLMSCGEPSRRRASSSSTKMAAALVYDCESRSGSQRESRVQNSDQIRRIFIRPELWLGQVGRSRARMTGDISTLSPGL